MRFYMYQLLVTFDLSNFKIVYSGTQNATLANSLKTKIKSATGASPSIVKATDTNEVEFELIIGNTSRDISKHCFDLAESDYITSTGILCDNGKIQILGEPRYLPFDAGL